jgi:capsular polysaccharide export protein
LAPQPDPKAFSAGEIPRRLFFYNGGFLWNRRLRRILALAGHDLCLGRPGPEDGVVVWGRSPTAGRGERIAARAGVPLIRAEDAFLRSLRPGRQGDAPMGLILDPFGVHFDSAVPSRIEHILSRHDLDDSNILARAKAGMARFETLNLSKYNIHDPDLLLPPPGYVLVIDQTQGDAAIRHGGASASTFADMLAAALVEHPGARVLIKTHPETAQGLRPGHFGPEVESDRIQRITAPLSPRGLLDGAIAVYTVTSQMGFEAILAGHRPRVFGQPFYAGWGLTDDRNPPPRRGRRLTAAQLFAACMILAPLWYDPCRDRLCSFEEAVDQMEAELRALREDRRGHVAMGMRLWKRGRLQAFFGGQRPLIFEDDPERACAKARSKGRGLLVWAAKAPESPPADVPLRRVEDGFLRSRGLGAELVPPLSLVTDDLGIYYDASKESRLERLIASPLPAHALLRAERLREKIITTGVSKYNLAGSLPDLPEGHRILVPGQVEDDASLRLGGGDIRSNLALLRAVRAANPTAKIIYKPHPDVEAGLRPGALSPETLASLADLVADHADPIALIAACDEVWTMTSLLGFEALLRGRPVTCLGTPFYAGWGLTRDLWPAPARRLRKPDGSPVPRPTLDHLVHAALVAYPRYYDPVSRRPCPPEVALDRLASGTIPHPGLANRLLSKLQGHFASYAPIWRRK